MRKAFTFIELIFVIVIIGILATVALPRLSATRDDAKVAVEITNLKQCIDDTLGAYMATGIENNNSMACSLLNCAAVDVNNSYDGKIKVEFQNSYSGKLQYCNYVKAKAAKADIKSEYNYGGYLVRE